MTQPPLRLLHSEAILSRVKLDQFRRLSTAELIESLALGRPGALKARPDGTVLDGHHRIVGLHEGDRRHAEGRSAAADELE